MSVKKHWLFKSEPNSYSIDHLQKDGTTAWTGIRNYLVRNYMRDEMHLGDEILFYHSSTAILGIYGLAKVASKSYPDPTQFDEKSHYFEPRATKEKPVWMLVDISFVKKFKVPVPMSALRENTKLHGLQLLRPHNRLSITPVTKDEFEEILKMAKAKE
jgi:predicted RNA-binding protein with PUA-like domain